MNFGSGVIITDLYFINHKQSFISQSRKTGQCRLFGVVMHSLSGQLSLCVPASPIRDNRPTHHPSYARKWTFFQNKHQDSLRCSHDRSFISFNKSTRNFRSWHAVAGCEGPFNSPLKFYVRNNPVRRAKIWLNSPLHQSFLLRSGFAFACLACVVRGPSYVR